MSQQTCNFSNRLKRKTLRWRSHSIKRPLGLLPVAKVPAVWWKPNETSAEEELGSLQIVLQLICLCPIFFADKGHVYICFNFMHESLIWAFVTLIHVKLPCWWNIISLILSFLQPICPNLSPKHTVCCEVWSDILLVLLKVLVTSLMTTASNFKEL